jgi:serine protease AprX
LAKAGFVDKNPIFPCYIAPNFLQYLSKDPNQNRPKQERETSNMKRFSRNSIITNSTYTFMPSRWRRMFCSLFFVAAAIGALGAIGSSRAIGQRVGDNAFHLGKIAPWVVEHTANAQQAEFFVVLTDQADLRQAAAVPTKTEKGRYVYETLRAKSQTAQLPILQWLRERGIQHRSFYIVNAILVKGTREIAQALAARPDVARIEGNPQIHNALPQPSSAVEAPSQPRTPETIEPGISYTHAPDVWALGFTGQGIVVASADTGVRWTHNALKPHYRGWDGQNADHNYNWHDAVHDSVGNPCGNDSPVPCDDHGHGSHTTGTAIGDDGAGNQIGMAPGAKWIACRNIDGPVNIGTPARYIECMEFFLAPYPVGGDPSQGDPTQAPDITNNSWGCPPSEGCSPDTLQAAVEAQRAAGIQMVVAAGNSGPDCSSVENPPAIYEASFTVGALSTGTDNITSFSSRGPVTIDGSNRIKPDITAPGAGNRSAWNSSDDAYGILSGTSMATPHIAGGMALLWSAIPNLQNQIDASRAVLNNAAVHIASTQCGDAGPPNNVYGWGRVDIFAAVTGTTPTPTPTPCGRPAWLQRAPMPFRAAGNFAACDGTFVYSGGGLGDFFTARNDLLRYDPVADSWTSLAPSPDYYFGSQAVSFNGKIYNIGGYNEAFQPTATTRIYDIATNTWTTGAPMPSAVGGMATALWNGVVYVAGGSPDFVNVVNTLYAYDVAANTWTTLSPMPQALWVPGFGAINGKLYVAAGGGGGGGITPLNTLYIYDISSNTWTNGANVPVATQAPGSAVLHGHLYLFGGLSPLIMTQIYNPGSNRWSIGPNMNSYRWQFYGTAVGNRSIVALGGDGAEGVSDPLDANEQLTTSPCGPRPHPTPPPHP